MSNKTAFITGGTKGIGFGIAESLIKNGYNVAFTSRSQEAADQAAEELERMGSVKVKGYKADARSFEDQQRAVNSCVKDLGSLDVLIANAGVGNFGSIEDISIDDWNETIETNLTGVFYTVKAALEPIKQSQGYIITISSLAGTNFFAGGSAYNASKFGLTGFSQAIMLDLRQYGVKVTTIMPGSVATYFNDHTPDENDAWKIQKEDLGQMVLDLLAMNPRTLPSKIEVRPTKPPKK